RAHSHRAERGFRRAPGGPARVFEDTPTTRRPWRRERAPRDHARRRCSTANEHRPRLRAFGTDEQSAACELREHIAEHGLQWASHLFARRQRTTIVRELETTSLDEVRERL